jgi:hypothetical protein
LFRTATELSPEIALLGPRLPKIALGIGVGRSRHSVQPALVPAQRGWCQVSGV